MSEYTKISLHNHFQCKENEVTIECPIDKNLNFVLDFAKDVLFDAKLNGFELIGYTPANKFSIEDYIRIKLLGVRLELEIIPGIEINLKSKITSKYMHVVVLFDPLSNIYEIAMNIDKYLNENGMAFLTLEQFVDISTKARCVVIPHGIKQSGADHSACTNEDLISEVLAADKTIPILLDGSKKFHKQVLITRLSDKLSEFELNQLEEIEIISSADRQKFNAILDPTYMWGGKTFNDLYYCALVGERRFIRKSDLLEKEKYIDYFSIYPNEKGELIKNDRIDLSHGLNSIVGLSGSGKTLLLNLIYYKLKSINMKNVSTSGVNYEEIYSNVNIILYDNQGNKINEEDLIVLEGDNLYNTLTMNYQDNRSEMFKKFETDIDLKYFTQSIAYFSSQCDDYVKNKQQLVKNEKKVNELIKNTIANQKSILLNKENTRFTVNYIYNSKQVDKFNSLEKNITEISEDLVNLRKIYQEISTLSTKYDAPNLLMRIQKDLVRLSKLITLTKSKQIKNKIEISEYTTKVKFIERLVNEYNKTTGKAGEEVVRSNQEINNNLVSILNLIKESIEIKSKLEIPRIDFDYLLKSLEKGLKNSDIARIKIKQRQLNYTKEILKEVFPNNISSNTSGTKIGLSKFNFDSYDIQCQSTIGNILDEFVVRGYNRKIEFSIDYEKFFDLDIEIRTENDNYKSVTQMSAGQIGKIYFKNIIKRDIKKDKVNVVFFDQPENNLEKDFILNDLSTLLNELKLKLQIIITTHEPLLVINADSNNIILATNNKKISGANHISYENITLIDSDNKIDSIETISKLIDGSIKAVTKRSEIYGGIINGNKTN